VEEYECVLGAGEEKYPIDQEVTIRLRNPDTLTATLARVIFRSSFEEYPDAHRLYYVIATSGREKDPVPLEVIEEMPDEAEEVKALPRQKLTLGQRKGRMLADMIKERQDKKKE